MDGQYEVLNPWAEVDPVPVRGIMPRVTDLKGKTIGLYSTHKIASRPIVNAVGERLKERFPTLKFSSFEYYLGRDVTESPEKDKFEEWVKGVDTVVAAVGD